jgi:hypothetical protein
MKIIQEIQLEKNVQKTRITLYFDSVKLCKKIKEKYNKFLEACSSKSCSFLFEKPRKTRSLQFQPKNKQEERFFHSLVSFFVNEKEKCQTMQEYEILENIVKTFLKKDSTLKTWTGFKIYLQSELQK